MNWIDRLIAKIKNMPSSQSEPLSLLRGEFTPEQVKEIERMQQRGKDRRF
jgi:hypothetical protein